MSNLDPGHAMEWKQKQNITLSDTTVPKSNIKIVERGKMVTPNTQMHDYSLAWYMHFNRKWRSSTSVMDPNPPLQNSYS